MSIPVCVRAAALVWLAGTLANISVRRAGWLDRLVQYHKQRFMNEVDEEVPVEINATIKTRPPGYEDSASWNYESVLRLLTLIRDSESAAPVRTALRRAFRPTRRIMDRINSFKHIPSLALKSLNYFYYPVLSDELYNYDSPETGTPHILQDDEVVYINNPVEARLPSGHISVGLLKEIMEARAHAARVMPSSVKPTFQWIFKNTPKILGGGGGAAEDGGGAGGGNETSPAAAGGANTTDVITTVAP